MALAMASYPGDVGPPAARATEPAAGSGIVGAARHLGRRRRNIAIVVVGWARSVVLGGLQPLMVVLAFENLDMQRGGPGLLGALVGAGAVASTVVMTLVARRSHLTPVLVVGLGASAAALVSLAAGVSLPAAVIALPVIGLAAAMVDGLGRLLLQRSCDPTALGPAFALFDLAVAVGFVSGAALVQAMLAVGDVRLALVALAVVAALVLAACVRPLWSADHVSDVPVVEMSLLRSLPMFAPLPPLALETVARSATYLPVDRGDVVVRQGEHGDCFYAVADGAFEVEMSGRRMRTARRNGFFGEVALLADVPRTATVSAAEPGELLVIERVPFLVAVTGSDTSRQVAWGIVRGLELDDDLPLHDPPDTDRRP
ncbi:MAG: cyclic nucleotide-binding domain-containing protein [Acidimicrobiales bacterium]